MRICSLLPSATEIVFALGLEDSLVAVTHECDYPPEAKRKAVVVKSAIDSNWPSDEIDRAVKEHGREGRSVYAIDLQALREADPELILTQEICDVCAVDYDEVVRAASSLPRPPRVLSLNPHRLSDVLRDIEKVGEATGKRNEGEELARRLRARIQQVKEQASRSERRPRVACLEWLDPLYSAGHWVPEMIDLAGGEDGLAHAGEPSAEITWNKVRDFAPEIVVLMPCGFDMERTLKEIHRVRQLPGWQEIPAVREGRVFAVNGHAYFNRPGPRLVDGLEILAQIVHPEIFPWQAPPEAAQKIREA